MSSYYYVKSRILMRTSTQSFLRTRKAMYRPFATITASSWCRPSSHLKGGHCPHLPQPKMLMAVTAAADSKRQIFGTQEWYNNYQRQRQKFYHTQNNNNRPTKPNRIDDNKNAIARNKHIIQLGKHGKWKDILLLYQQEKDGYTNVNYATTMNQLGKIMTMTMHTTTKNNNHRILLITHDALFVDFMDDLLHKLQHHRGGMEWMGVRELSNCIHALGKLFHRSNMSRSGNYNHGDTNENDNYDKDVVNKIIQNLLVDWMDQPKNIQYFVSRGNAQDISNVIWACGVMNISMPNLFRQVEDHAPQFIHMATTLQHGRGSTRPTTQAVSNTIWAFAKLGYTACPNLLTEINNHAEVLVSKSKPQHIANVCWAFAKIVVDSKAAVASSSSSGTTTTATNLFVNNVYDGNIVTKKQDTQNDINESIILPEKLFAVVDNNAEWFIKEGDTQNISNTLWSFATLGFNRTKLFTTIEQHANHHHHHRYSKRLIQQAKNPQEVANIVWSFATLHVKAPYLFQCVEERMEWCIERGSSQAISNIIWSFGVVFEYYSPKLVSLVNANSSRLVKHGNAQFVSNVALAFATLGVNKSSCTNFFDTLNHPRNMNKLLVGTEVEQGILNTCYSLVILDLSQTYQTMLTILWKKVLKDFTTKKNSLTQEQLIQLVQIQMYAKASGVDLPNPTCPILHKKMKTVQSDKHQSDYQIDISNILQYELGFQHDQEVPPTTQDEYQHTGILNIDMACSARKIAIEYDGYFHFLNDFTNPSGNDATTIPNGATKAKRRFLQQCGWKVISITYQEWNHAIQTNHKAEWLRQRLRKEGVHVL